MEREKRKTERQGLPELNITLMYESFIWAQALFSAHMNEIRDTKHLHLNDMVFNCDKYCQRFEKQPTAGMGHQTQHSHAPLSYICSY